MTEGNGRMFPALTDPRALADLAAAIGSRPGWALKQDQAIAVHSKTMWRLGCVGGVRPWELAAGPQTWRFAGAEDAVEHAERLGEPVYDLATAAEILASKRCSEDGHDFMVRTSEDGSPALIACGRCPRQWVAAGRHFETVEQLTDAVATLAAVVASLGQPMPAEVGPVLREHRPALLPVLEQLYDRRGGGADHSPASGAGHNGGAAPVTAGGPGHSGVDVTMVDRFPPVPRTDAGGGETPQPVRV